MSKLIPLLQARETRRKTIYQQPSAFYLNTRPPYPPIISRRISMFFELPCFANYLSPRLLWSTPIFLQSLHHQPITPPHWAIHASPLDMSKPSQSRLLHIVHHGGHFHFGSNIFIFYDFITSSLVSLQIHLNILFPKLLSFGY